MIPGIDKAEAAPIPLPDDSVTGVVAEVLNLELLCGLQADSPGDRIVTVLFIHNLVSRFPDVPADRKLQSLGFWKLAYQALIWKVFYQLINGFGTELNRLLRLMDIF